VSAWISGFVFVAAIVGLAIGGMLLVRRSVTLSTLESHNQVAGYIYSVVGVVYAVLLAFIVIIVWQKHTEVQVQVEQEANQLDCKIKFAPIAESSWKRNGRGWLKGRLAPMLGPLSISSGEPINRLRREMITRGSGMRNHSISWTNWQIIAGFGC
jgi:hypothetical protein